MSYSAATDFLGLLRLTGGGLRTERMPGLDWLIQGLARMGLISVSVGQSAPTVSQATTVWLKPAQPSWNAEGAVYLWNAADNQYEPATPALWSNLITAVFPATALPLVDAGLGNVGVSLLYARQDHVHPTDTTRAPLASPLFTGSPQAPTPAFGDNSLNIATTAFVQTAAGVTPPIGSILPYTGNTPPSGNWVVANGQAISRTTFANAFSIMGITFGSGDGITTFNVPDLRGRVVAGIDGGANRLTAATMSSQAMAGVGGAEVQTLTTAQIPAHTHPNSLTDPTHVHSFTAVLSNPSSATAGGALSAAPPSSTNTAAASTGITITNNVNAGGGGSHVNVQPTMELQYIVRVS